MELPFNVEKADQALAQVDREMAKIIKKYGPCQMTIRPVLSPFASLFRSIIFQQLSTASATAIYNRAIGFFKNETPTPEATLLLSDEELRSVGMSKQKIAYSRDLAQKSIDGVVPDLAALNGLTDEEILDRLTAVKGIGRWTVEMLLMFSLGRPDVLPSTDLAIRKGFQQVYGYEVLPKPKEIDTFGELWRPYRTVASWYLWRVIDGDNDAW